MSELTTYVVDVLDVFKEPLAYGFAIMISFGVLARLISLARS
jgi:hypothetical protein